jgi:hypothetical protein
MSEAIKGMENIIDEHRYDCSKSVLLTLVD